MKSAYYLDQTFKKGTTLEESRVIKQMLREGKNIKSYLNDSPTAIYLGVTINSHYIKVNTDEKIKPVHWDGKSQRVKNTYTNCFELNHDLTNLKNKVERAYRNFKDANPYAGAEEIKILLNQVVKGTTPVKKEVKFYEAFTEYLLDKGKSAKSNTVRRHHAILKHLKGFERENYPITFEGITENFEKDFRYYMVTVKLLNNTIAKTIITLKVFLRWALSKKYTANSDFLQFKTKYEDTEIIYLTDSELMKLMDLDLNGNLKLTRVRDSFCFQSVTGQRFSDIKNLHWNDLRKKEDGSYEWHLYQIKGNKPNKVVIPLIDYAVEILEKYPNRLEHLQINTQVLPVYSDQKMNDYIKVICRLAGFTEKISLVKYSGKKRITITKEKWQLITTHCARKTFVTLSLEKKMRPEVIQSITGHEDYRTMKRYIKIADEVKTKELNKAWGKKPVDPETPSSDN